MRGIKFIILGFLLVGESIPQNVLSHTITIENFSGEKIELGLDTNDRFLDVLGKIQTYFQEEMLVTEGQENDLTSSELSFSHPYWSLHVSHAGLTARAKKWRDYQVSVSREEKEDIRFIVRTLAWKQVWEIWNQQDSLEKAGDRIKHLHPLRFCFVLFSDEELKAGVAAIRDRTKKIRDGFFDGITGSLKEEASRKNLLPFVEDFAKKLNIEEKWIYPSLEKGQWKEFVNILIDKIPREKDPNRYDM